MSLILNVACGKAKIEGTVSIDCEPSCKPDVLANVLKGLPYVDGCVDKIFFFHAIEHIQKILHPQVLKEFHRLLKDNGTLVVSYPEFKRCAINWIENYRGMRKFWEATLYGRQLYPTDFHIALMDTQEFRGLLEEVGFAQINWKPEPNEPYNTVVTCTKGNPLTTYEEVVKREIFG